MTSKTDEYSKYIRDHIQNVALMYRIFGSVLHEVFLGASIREMIQRVENHDKSKWSDEEFEPYRVQFFPDKNEKSNIKVFSQAWKHHYENNDHHPEYWFYDSEGIMSDGAAFEMMLDWLAMSYYFSTSCSEWYNNSDEKNMLDDATKNKVNKAFRYLDTFINASPELKEYKQII